VLTAVTGWSVEAAGFSAAQMLEIVAPAGQNILNNLLNNVARPDIDFPPPPR
jgi:hypothetical protein